MVWFYDEYSSETFIATIRIYLNTEFVQMPSASIAVSDHKQEIPVIVQPKTAQFVQPTVGQMPKILELKTLTNHI